MLLGRNFHPSRLNDIEVMLHETTDRLALFSSPDFRQRMRDRLFLDRSIEVWSLDVFDTILLRDDSSELTRFYEIGKLMSDEVNLSGRLKGTTPLDAFVARHLGTKATYRGSDDLEGCVEGALSEIHLVSSRVLTGADEWVDRFIELELGYEAGRLQLNDALVDMVAEFKAGGGRVILMSDMYMSSAHIETLLHNANVDLALFDVIFSSADIKYSKHSGKAFPHIVKHLGVVPANVLHVGDNFGSDFVNAIDHGLKALHLPIPERNIGLRRDDHVKTAEALLRDHGISIDIAMPR